MSSHSFAGLPAAIQQLLQQRSNHVDAMEAIDATLARATEALGLTASVTSPTKIKVKPSAAPKPKTKTGKSVQTASEFVLGFVKDNKNPTSKEINAAWKAAGRKWSADVMLSKLTKTKTLTRTPLGEGKLGSRYAIST